jgi:hypothetical protein
MRWSCPCPGLATFGLEVPQSTGLKSLHGNEGEMVSESDLYGFPRDDEQRTVPGDGGDAVLWERGGLHASPCRFAHHSHDARIWMEKLIGNVCATSRSS